MNKFFLKILILISIIIPTNSFSAERVDKGTVLEEDSMVFSIEEAQDMAKYISKLEEELKNSQDLIREKNFLIDNQNSQLLLYSEFEDLKQKQILKYQEIQKIDEDRIKKLEKRLNFKKIENGIWFAGGIISAISIIVIADQLDDRVLESNILEQSSRSSARVYGFKVRF